jgi:hypothetical protein
VEQQRAFHVAAIDELIDLAIGIAGDIAEHRVMGRPFVQAMDRRDRKQLGSIAQLSGIDWNSAKLQ